MLLDKTKKAGSTYERFMQAETKARPITNIQQVVDKLSMGQARDIDIKQLRDYPNHKYTTYDIEHKESLKKSIAQSGLAQPLLVWHDIVNGGNYYILAGHNRKEACKELGFEKISCIIKEGITRAEADLLVQTNMDQRGLDDYSLLDKCQNIVDIFNDIEEIKKDNKLKDDTYSALLNNDDTDKDLSLYFGLKKSQLYIYRKIGKTLNKSWFDLYPTKWDLDGGFQISFLKKELLDYLFNYLKNNNVKLNKRVGSALRKFDDDITKFEYYLNSLFEVKKDKKDNNATKTNTTNTTTSNSTNNATNDIIYDNLNDDDTKSNESIYIIDVSTLPEFSIYKDKWTTKEEIKRYLSNALKNYNNEETNL